MHPPTLVFGSTDASTGRRESESESEIEDNVKSIHSERSYQMDSKPDSDKVCARLLYCCIIEINKVI